MTDPATFSKRSSPASVTTPSQRLRTEDPRQGENSGVGRGSPPVAPARLCADSLQELVPKLHRGIEVPNYNRKELSIGHIHFGPGNFFRALIAPHAHDMMCYRRPGWNEWGISAVSISDGNGTNGGSSSIHDLRKQDGLYTVITRGRESDSAAVIGSIAECLVAKEDSEIILARLADPEVKLVTLTITSKGYCLAEDGELDRSNGGLSADWEHPTTPRTALGFIVEGLRRRMEGGVQPFTVMSFDNIPPNGEKTRGAMIDYAQLVDPRLSDWIRDNVPFPTTMADRITPTTTEEDRLYVANWIGVEDRVPVVTEKFSLLAIQTVSGTGSEKLATALPLWAINNDKVVLSEDVLPYAVMKARLVNAVHVVVAWLGTRMGHESVHQVMAYSQFRNFLGHLMKEEIAPALEETPGFNVASFIDDVLERFENSRMPDRLARLNNAPSIKIPERILEPIRAAIRANCPYDRLLTTVGAFMLTMRPFPDPEDITRVHFQTERSRRLGNTPQDTVENFRAFESAGALGMSNRKEDISRMVEAFLSMPKLFGEDLPNDPQFVAKLHRTVAALSQHTVLEVIESIDSGTLSELLE